MSDFACRHKGVKKEKERKIYVIMVPYIMKNKMMYSIKLGVGNHKPLFNNDPKNNVHKKLYI